MLRSIIVEGIDRVGKNSMINGVQQRLGFFQQIHYQKPEILECFRAEARGQLNLPDGMITDEVNRLALRRYQHSSFATMFKLLSSDARLILNRAHLGEFVYAPRYRKYSGDYVFELERHFKDQGSSFHETTLLVLLHTSSFDFIKDDGLSFDFNKKDEEQIDFVRAFERSEVKHKLMLDVHDGAGSYVPMERLLDVVVQAYQELPMMEHQTLNVSWTRDEDGGYTRNNYLQPDLRSLVS